MGKQTKIDWADATWNPVTGCLHGCEYCYARRIAERFGGCYRFDLPPDKKWREGRYDVDKDLIGDYKRHSDGSLHVLDEPERNYSKLPYEPGDKGEIAPYPYRFDPTFHRYKLDEPRRWKKPRNIFVCSMADLFGDWVPLEWIQQVFEACEAAPQHRYLFLTKNPKRYVNLYANGTLRVNDHFWYGTTVTGPNEPFFYSRVPDDNPHTFCSVEPLRKPLGAMQERPEWMIVGAETGNRKGKIVPQKEWIDKIAAECRRCRIPIFMKESLREIMGDDFQQEFPWGRADR